MGGVKLNLAMNEAETRAELIDPALKEAGWGVVQDSRVRREQITLGRLEGAGKRAKPEIADYVLTYRNHKLAVIEAKKRSLPDTEGVGQHLLPKSPLKCRLKQVRNLRIFCASCLMASPMGFHLIRMKPDVFHAARF